MRGPEFTRPRPEIVRILSQGSTASFTTILKRMGIDDIWMPIKPLITGMRTIGPALTIRSVPHRGDIGRDIAYAEGTLWPGHPDAAIDAIQPGDVVVLDGRGSVNEGLFGDLLTMRIKEMGAAGLVCDMAVRDGPHLAEKGIPIFCLGTAAPGGTVYNVDFNVPIGCAGCLVCPGDIIVGDDDGVVVIPQALVDYAVQEIQEIEARETFIREMLAQGYSQHGLYPMGPEMETRFQKWREKLKPSR
ncbi:MAG: ribonuclease activity regulator RraA [Anaerolineae bacterium]|nr:ribonuclease activity regulator RraA [Anaerolineae bacterium]